MELVKRYLKLYLRSNTGTVMPREGVTVAGKDRRHIELFGVLNNLLHPGARFVVVILGLDQGQLAGLGRHSSK